MQKRKLSPEVAGKYNLVGVEVGTHDFNGFGVFDLTTISLEKADELVGRGFYWLVPKKAKLSNSLKA